MFRIIWYWALLPLIALLSFGISLAGGVSPSERTHRIHAFQFDRLIPAPWRSCEVAPAETGTLDGKRLAAHPRNATVYALWDKISRYLSFESFLEASVKATVTNCGKTVVGSS